jgi:hypothetical protein
VGIQDTPSIVTTLLTASHLILTVLQIRPHMYLHSTTRSRTSTENVVTLQEATKEALSLPSPRKKSGKKGGIRYEHPEQRPRNWSTEKNGKINETEATMEALQIPLPRNQEERGNPV